MTNEKELIRQAQSGDRAAMDLLVQKYLPLVIKLAKRICPERNQPNLLKDAKQEGILALIQSIKGFDLEKEVKLSTYSYPRIQGAISDHLREESTRGVHGSRDEWDFVRKVNKIHDRLAKEGNKPSAQQIAEKMGENLEKVNKALKLRSLPFESLKEIYESRVSFAVYTQKDCKRDIKDAIEQIEREDWKEILIERYLNGKTLIEIAEEKGEKKNTVKVWHMRAMKELEKVWNAYAFREINRVVEEGEDQ